ncbi:MAG TPA: hypothetical protein VF367_07780 [Candidatus Limnocylindria bacterium]|jgi:hypothetical protein
MIELPTEEATMAYWDEVDYGPHEDDTFNVWIEFGARDDTEARYLEHSPSRTFILKAKSSSDEAEQLLHEPLDALLAAEIPGVTPASRITSTVLHHERGLRYRIIRAKATVEQSSGDVHIEFDKETW